MELTFPTFPSIFTLFLLFIYLLSKIISLTKTKSKFNSTPSNLPPGPLKLPLIGNMHQLLGSSPPHHLIANLAKKHGPLMHPQLGQVPIIVVSSSETSKEVMKTNDIIFARRPHRLAPSIITYNCRDIVFSPYGKYWRQLRKICTMELLSSARVQSFRHIREEEVSNLIETISLNSNSVLPVNLTKHINILIHTIISRAAVGKKCKEQQEFVSAIMQILSLASGFSIAEMYPSIEVLEHMTGLRPKLEKLRQKVDRIIENIINENKRGTKSCSNGDVEDLVDVLLKVQQQGILEFPLSDDSFKAIILDVFTAGSETSASTIEWAMAELLKNPESMKMVQVEIRNVFKEKGRVDENEIHKLFFLKSVIKETLRLHPPVSLIARECGKDCKINGYDIPANMKIFINTWAIGRDPSYWTEPERFNSERFLDSEIDYKNSGFQFLLFGSGRRICPEISLVPANIELLLAQLLYHFYWQLPDGLEPEDIDMTEANGLTISKRENLYLIPVPHHPLNVE